MALSETLLSQGRHVMRVLGVGHTERIYHNALITALNRAGVQHRSEVTCPIWFMGQCVGVGRADLVVGDLVVEIKANRLPPRRTSPQLQKYINSLIKAEKSYYRGMVVNFNQKTGAVDFYEDKEVRSALFLRSLVGEERTPPPPIFRRKAD